jgi:hypothetical protein
MIRGFKYIFIPALAAGLATVSATAADETIVPVGGQHGIDSWKGDGGRGLWLHARDGLWFYARMDGVCPALESAAQLAFRPTTRDGLDRSGAVLAAGQSCPLASVVQSDKPAIAFGG